MVAIRDTHSKDNSDFRKWLSALSLNEDEKTELERVYTYCCVRVSNEEDIKSLTKVIIEIIGILMSIHMDLESIIIAVIYPFIKKKYLTLEQVEKSQDKKIGTLLRCVKDMESIRFLHTINSEQNVSEAQVDTVRRMLLAMVEDVRAVIIKLAERIATLREIKTDSEDKRVLIAKEISKIYAPLANRLGIGQLKWELEDLSFRYLHPDIYKQIAKLLDEKRIDREIYINNFVKDLKVFLEEENITAEVYGRPKHIYSIWRKMQKKHVDFAGLYDVRAVRIIVSRIQDCYSVLGVIHTRFHHIPKEFDDYIANPKANGYKSIHTVIIGPEGKTIEIQIRTADMHKDAELGVAAHWKYKEGKNSNLDAAFEERISWLRKLLAWQEDVSENCTLVDEFKTQVFEDRVYVFTPKGDVVDLPVGATPLDFAYHIHSMIGHRCVGAKVDGRMVSFTYQLQTGEQVYLYTQKEPNPSRDWLNPTNGFLKTSKARAKVVAWFKKIDKEKNVVAGKTILEKELEHNSISLSKEQLPNILKETFTRYNAKELNDIYAGIGSGDIRINQIVHFITEKLKELNKNKDDDSHIIKTIEQRTLDKLAHSRKTIQKNQIIVNDVGNLVTYVAKCCHPIPGEDIVGFITQGRGVSIHRQDCETVKNLLKMSPERIVEAKWGNAYSTGVPVTIGIQANDRGGLLRDITTIIANEKINVLGVRSRSNVYEQVAYIDVDMEIYNIGDLKKVLGKLNRLGDVLSAKRL